MIGMMVSLNNILLIVHIQYIYYFGFLNGKQERSEMDFMVLALLLYTIQYKRSSILRCSLLAIPRRNNEATAEQDAPCKIKEGSNVHQVGAVGLGREEKKVVIFVGRNLRILVCFRCLCSLSCATQPCLPIAWLILLKNCVKGLDCVLSMLAFLML